MGAQGGHTLALALQVQVRLAPTTHFEYTLKIKLGLSLRQAQLYFSVAAFTKRSSAKRVATAASRRDDRLQEHL